MSSTNSFMNEERLFCILTQVINKLKNQIGIPEEEILEMFEISEKEIRELTIIKSKLN